MWPGPLTSCPRGWHILHSDALCFLTFPQPLHPGMPSRVCTARLCTAVCSASRSRRTTKISLAPAAGTGRGRSSPTMDGPLRGTWREGCMYTVLERVRCAQDTEFRFWIAGARRYTVGGWCGTMGWLRRYNRDVVDYNPIWWVQWSMLGAGHLGGVIRLLNTGGVSVIPPYVVTAARGMARETMSWMYRLYSSVLACMPFHHACLFLLRLS